MIVANRHLVRVVLDPLEEDTPLIVDPDRVVGGQISAQFLEASRGGNPQILQTSGSVERFELALCAARNPVELAYDGISEEPLRPLVAEGQDRSLHRFALCA
jgi:hypothetical protein